MANVPQSKNDRGARWDNTQDTIARLPADDGVSQWEVQANNLYGWDSAGSTWRRVKVDSTGTLVGGVSGGGPATIADGADVAQGTTSDAAWVSGSGTVISLLKKIASAGGSAVSVADGADVAQGTTTDLSSANTVVGILKAIKAAITGTLTVGTHAVTLASTTITGTVDTSDRAGRLLGIVDKGKLWDGTNIAAVKAASAAPVATDPALVVTISPNSPASSGGLTDTQLRATAVPISAAALPLPTGASTETTLAALSVSTNTLIGSLKHVPVGAQANASAQTWTEGSFAPLSQTLAGALRIGGTVTSAQGTAGGIGAAWFMKLTDGAGASTATVKAASTAAVATDPALVVALSPNNAATTELSTGLTTFNNTALTNTKTAIKAGAGKVYGWMVHNPSAATAFIQVWNVAIGSITVGTTAPTWVIPLPAGASANVFTDRGITHSTEINVAATTTATGSTAPATALVVSVFYI